MDQSGAPNDRVLGCTKLPAIEDMRVVEEKLQDMVSHGFFAGRTREAAEEVIAALRCELIDFYFE